VPDDQDTMPPTLSCTATPTALWPPDHRLVDVSVSCDVDDDSGWASLTLVAVTSNEPDDARGDGDGQTTGDTQGFHLGTADTSGTLRAERAARGSGRTYTLVYVASDAAGNDRTIAVGVPVTHDQGAG
jgi:hypothetical protein